MAKTASPTTTKVTDEATIVPSLKRVLTSDNRTSYLTAKEIFYSLVFRLELLAELFRSKGAFAQVLGDGNTVDFDLFQV